MRRHVASELLFAGCLVALSATACGAKHSDLFGDPALGSTDAGRRPPRADASHGPEGDDGDTPDGGSAANDAESDAGTAAEAACQHAAEVSCAREKQCGAELFAYYYVDEASCVQTKLLQGACVSSLGAPGSGKTTASVTACADATAAATCAQIRESVYGSPLAECLPVAGTLPDGSSCFSNWQCQSARCSLDATRSDGCGRCRTPKKTGEACTSPADCSFGSTCSSAKQCVTLGILGSACDATHPCNGAHTCSGGTCKEYPATPGAACDPSSNCDFVSAGLSCNSLKKQCTKEVENPPGKPCGWNSTTGDYQYCGRGGVCSGTTCVAKVGAGAACDSSKSLYCDVPYQCLGGVCKAFDPSVCKFF